MRVSPVTGITCQQASNDGILSDKYGYEIDRSKQNYVYQLKSGTSNLRHHLRNQHAAIYDKTVQENNWPYPLSTEEPHAKPTVGQLHKSALPSFTLESFNDYLVRFVVTDNQVSNLFHFLTHVLTFS